MKLIPLPADVIASDGGATFFNLLGIGAIILAVVLYTLLVIYLDGK